MNNSTRSLVFYSIITLLALVSSISVGYVDWENQAAFEKAEDDARKGRLGCNEATDIFFGIEIYQLSKHPHAGEPLALEDFMQDSPSLCQDVRNWKGPGRFYLLGHVPRMNEPYAVYVLGDISVPDVKKYPWLEISALVRKSLIGQQ